MGSMYILLWKSSIWIHDWNKEHYKRNPAYVFNERIWKKTEDYKEQVKKIDKMVQRNENNQLITIAIVFVVIISLSLIITCC